MAETPLHGSGKQQGSFHLLSDTYEQAAELQVSGEKAKLTGQGFPASLPQKCPLRRGVPSKGQLPSTQCTEGVGDGCTGKRLHHLRHQQGLR